MTGTTSVIHPSARIGAGTTFGDFCVIGANVTLGEGCRVGHHVVIHADTVVGANVRIDDHASLGKLPMKAANSATTKEQDLPPLTVGDLCIVGTGVVLYRGAAIDGKVLMADQSTVRENVTVGPRHHRRPRRDDRELLQRRALLQARE
jgi:UDP-3-O-[3-hydroxymyristoyl] glucosamine N-acyltransferase